MRLAIGIAAAVAAVFASVGASSGVRADASPLRGTVAEVVDPATIRVRLPNRKLVTVRLLAVEGPGPRSCFTASAIQRVRALALGKRIRVSGDPGAIRRAGGRLVGYVTLPGNRDLARIALLRGLVSIPPGPVRAARLEAYRETQRVARTNRAGIWSCTDPSTEDRVTADLRRPRRGGGEVHVVVDAWSRADGEHPRGLFRMTATTPEGITTKVSGRVVCLTVSGNRATIGGVVEQSTDPAAPLEIGYRLHLTDHGEPGASLDTNANVGYAKAVPCPIEDVAEIVITEGEIVVADASP